MSNDQRNSWGIPFLQYTAISVSFNTTVWHVDKNVKRDIIKVTTIYYINVIPKHKESLIFCKTSNLFTFKYYKNY